MSLTQGTEAYKRGRMEMVHTWLPKRKVLCVGDSTQSDPEAYGDIYRMYKGWVKKIFIRKVRYSLILLSTLYLVQHLFSCFEKYN